MYGGLMPKQMHVIQGEFTVPKYDETHGYALSVLPLVLGRKSTPLPKDLTPESGDTSTTEIIETNKYQVGNKIGKSYLNMLLWASDPEKIAQMYVGVMYGAFDSVRRLSSTNYLNPDVDINYINRLTTEDQNVSGYTLDDKNESGGANNSSDADWRDRSTWSGTQGNDRGQQVRAGIGDTVIGISGNPANQVNGDGVLQTHLSRGILDIRTDPQKAKWYSMRRFIRFFQGRPVEIRKGYLPRGIKRINPGTFFVHYFLNQSKEVDIKVQYEFTTTEYWHMAAQG